MDLGNLNIHIPIPVVNKAGRGTAFSYTLSYDSSIWFPVSSSGAESWQPVTNWGWRGETEAAIGYITFDSYDTSCNVLVDGINHVYTYIEEDGFVYHDPSGTAHGFNISYNNAPSACGIGRGTFSGIANDGSGYAMNTSGVVTTRDGRPATWASGAHAGFLSKRTPKPFSAGSS